MRNKEVELELAVCVKELKFCLSNQLEKACLETMFQPIQLNNERSTNWRAKDPLELPPTVVCYMDLNRLKDMKKAALKNVFLPQPPTAWQSNIVNSNKITIFARHLKTFFTVRTQNKSMVFMRVDAQHKMMGPQNRVRKYRMKSKFWGNAMMIISNWN